MRASISWCIRQIRRDYRGFAPSHSRFVVSRCDAPTLRAESALMISNKPCQPLIRVPLPPAPRSRVWNLKSIAVVFYFCVLFIVGRYAMYYFCAPLEEWIEVSR